MVYGKNINLPSVTLSRRKREIRASFPAIRSHCNVDGEGSKCCVNMERSLHLWRRCFHQRQCAAPLALNLCEKFSKRSPKISSSKTFTLYQELCFPYCIARLSLPLNYSRTLGQVFLTLFEP